MNNTSSNEATENSEKTELLMIIIAGLYALLFLVGVSGNLWVMFTLARMNRNLQLTGRRGRQARNLFRQNHLYFYILALCLTDFVWLWILPLTIQNLLLQRWDFGHFLCKLYFAVENVNKLLSISLLTCFSLDRYLGVCAVNCFPKLRTLKGAVGLVLGCAVFSIALLLPVLFYSSVKEYKHYTACEESMPQGVANLFLASVLLFGYCVPAVLITFFYTSVLNTVRAQIRSNIGSAAGQQRLKGVVRTIQLTVGFYFACWTPYWLFVLITFFNIRGAVSVVFGGMRNLVIITSFIYILPAVNSAGNWIFYALLNRDIRESTFNSMQSQVPCQASELSQCIPKRPPLLETQESARGNENHL